MRSYIEDLLAEELRRRGFSVMQQAPFYDTRLDGVGRFHVDLLVDGLLAVEIDDVSHAAKKKAARDKLRDEHLESMDKVVMRIPLQEVEVHKTASKIGHRLGALKRRKLGR